MFSYNVIRTVFLRVGVLSVRVGSETSVEPPCRPVACGTASIEDPVIILVRCRELHFIVVSQAIPYNHIGYERNHKN